MLYGFGQQTRLQYGDVIAHSAFQIEKKYPFRMQELLEIEISLALCEPKD